MNHNFDINNSVSGDLFTFRTNKEKSKPFPFIEPITEVTELNTQEEEVIINATKKDKFSFTEDILESHAKKTDKIDTNYNEIKNDILTKEELNEMTKDIKNYIEVDEIKIRKSYSEVFDDYLRVDIRFDSKLEENFNCFLFNFKYTYEIQERLEFIDSNKFDDPSKIKIGPVSTFEYLVESSCNSDFMRKNSIIEKLVLMNEEIFRWRRIAGDGNCFYRSVIFGYIENIIFTRNIKSFRILILEIVRFSTEEILFLDLLKENKINIEALITYLVCLYESLIEHKEEKYYSKCIEQTYDRYLKLFNNIRAFDLGLIIYFRYKMYEFLKLNSDKLYTKDFSIKVGNLLPNNYETEEGLFLFEKFYVDYLLKLYEDAEKIVIYLTPFVMKINLNILIYDFGKSSLEKIKEFVCPTIEDVPTIRILYKKTHYDLIYEKDYFNRNTKYLTNFVNLNEKLKVIDGKILNQVDELIKSQKNKNKIENDISTISKNDTSLSMIVDTLNDIKLTESIYISNIKTSFKYCNICNFEESLEEINVCRICLVSEVRASLIIMFIKYIDFGRNKILNNNKEVNLTGIFEAIFNIRKIKVSDNYLLTKEEAFDLIKVKFEDFFVKEIKNNICISCNRTTFEGMSNSNKIILPCNCVLCCIRCMDSYFNILFSRGIQQLKIDFYCFCNYNYNSNELKSLILLNHSNNRFHFKEKLKQIFQEKIFSQCMICLCEIGLKDDYFINASMIDQQVFNYFAIKKFNHLICSICFLNDFTELDYEYHRNKIAKFKIDRQQICMICDLSHNIKEIAINRNIERIKKEDNCKIY